MTHPYRKMAARSFWKRSVAANWDVTTLPAEGSYLRKGERIASAGSCFAANMIPYLEERGFTYVRTELRPDCFGPLGEDNFSYDKFSAAYGNIYTVRQAVQLVRRALGRFTPTEDRWVSASNIIIDPFRPGLKFPATSHGEFEALRSQHLASVIRAIKLADVFIYTLGLTEAWVSDLDGAVFPACPGTIAGSFDAQLHRFHNFTTAEVNQDLDDFVEVVRYVNPNIRIVLTVSPVPLVATATQQHVLCATLYSKSVLRAAAGEAVARHRGVSYFPAYEIVAGPQAPQDFFDADRREPSLVAIQEVMRCFLTHCGTAGSDAVGEQEVDTSGAAAHRPNQPVIKDGVADNELLRHLSGAMVKVQCEEAAAGL